MAVDLLARDHHLALTEIERTGLGHAVLVDFGREHALPRLHHDLPGRCALGVAVLDRNRGGRIDRRRVLVQRLFEWSAGLELLLQQRGHVDGGAQTFAGVELTLQRLATDLARVLILSAVVALERDLERDLAGAALYPRAAQQLI